MRMSDESQGPPPPLDRKVSTYSETDSGVDVDNEPEEGTELGVDKKVIKPDLDIISRLCNFDEEEEEALTESEEEDEEEDDCYQVVRETDLNRVSVTLTELRHILSALVKQHTEEEREASLAHHVLVGKSCSVCSQNIFSMFLYTGNRCEICSFIVCIHCSLQVELLPPETVYDLPVTALTPDVVQTGARQQSTKFSSLSVSSLESSGSPTSSLTCLASRMWGRVTRSPANSSICSTCSYVINQAF